jgi:hypothetical protein
VSQCSGWKSPRLEVHKSCISGLDTRDFRGVVVVFWRFEKRVVASPPRSDAKTFPVAGFDKPGWLWSWSVLSSRTCLEGKDSGFLFEHHIVEPMRRSVAQKTRSFEMKLTPSWLTPHSRLAWTRALIHLWLCWESTRSSKVSVSPALPYYLGLWCDLRGNGEEAIVVIVFSTHRHEGSDGGGS